MIKRGLIIFIVFYNLTVNAQIGIGTQTPNASAVLDIEATSKGVLFPRVALQSVTDNTTIVNPATSLLVYNTGTSTLTTTGFYYNGGTPSLPSWVRLSNVFNATTQLLTDSTTITWNTTLGYNASVTLNGNRTLSISGASGGTYGTLVIKQNATGNRTIALPTNSKIRSGGGVGNIPILTPDANAIDILSFFYDGTTYWWVVGNNFN
jgi:hypothetical protein